MNFCDLCERPLATDIHIILKTMEQTRFQYEFSHRLADGFSKEVEIFVSKIEFLGTTCFHAIIHDITGKKQAENKLMLLTKAIDQSPLSIFITNPRGEIEYVNKKYTELTGYSSMEAIGSLPNILKPGTHSPKTYKKLWETISSGKDWSGEIMNKKKDGTEFLENGILSPMVSGTGQLTNYIGIKEDITHKRQMIQEIIDAKERAEESDRLKSAFLANMSHEIRTPLNVILGHVNILTSEEDLSADDKTELTAIIRKSSEDLLQVINDVLDASKLETNQIKIEKKPVELQPFFMKLLDHFNQKIKKENKGHIQLKLLPFKDPGNLTTDAKRLFQVFSNLLNNSIKFTNEGMVSFGINKITRGEIEFFVSDTGIGVPPGAESVIFEPFRQAETTHTRLYGGAGLGLSITKKLLDFMGGSIRLHSQNGEGTTFFFLIPLKAGQPIHQKQNAIHRNKMTVERQKQQAF
jgi:PAS domain S-box-containing protein